MSTVMSWHGWMKLIADRHDLQRLERKGVLSRGSNTDGQSFVCQIREDVEEKAQSP